MCSFDVASHPFNDLCNVIPLYDVGMLFLQAKACGLLPQLPDPVLEEALCGAPAVKLQEDTRNNERVSGKSPYLLSLRDLRCRYINIITAAIASY